MSLPQPGYQITHFAAEIVLSFFSLAFRVSVSSSPIVHCLREILSARVYHSECERRYYFYGLVNKTCRELRMTPGYRALPNQSIAAEIIQPW